MIFFSTRNKALRASGCEAVLRGPAQDGGLYMPETFPHLPAEAVLELDTLGIAKKILGAYFDDLAEEEISQIIDSSYKGRFETEDVTPLADLNGTYVLELFRGPTQAFKDVALSVLPRLMAAAQKKLGVKKEMLILTATSGDTGKAALAGFCGVPGTRIIVFYPEGGVSPIQHLQMATQEGENVCVCAVRGNFDDVQTGVKAIFASEAARSAFNAHGLLPSSANSINIGRLVPQILYYYKAYGDLVKSGAIDLGKPVDFAVPTGNFGNILAGYFAKQMGLPVGKLLCASNANDVLTEFLHTGRYDCRRTFYKTASPSMDILISSNLERLLYCVCGEKTRAYMERLGRDGWYEIDPEELKTLQKDFFAARCGDAECFAAIRRAYQETGYLCDTHTAVALDALSQYRRAASDTAPAVVLSTASPFKFPADVLSALNGSVPQDEFEAIAQLEKMTGAPAPKALTGLKEKRERHRDTISLKEMEAYVIGKAAQATW